MTAGLRLFDAAVAAEYERVHTDFECSAGMPDEWDIVAPPEPCERCGTRVFALRDRVGTIALFHVGPVRGDELAAVAVQHLPDRCSAARRHGVQLEGMTAPRLRVLVLS